jgi:hypothetical protein
LPTSAAARHPLAFDRLLSLHNHPKDTWQLKLKRASKRIDELNAFLREERPFTYVVQTDTITGQRATLAKKNETIADEAAAIAGDAAHNLRSALDHVYWSIVSPFATTPKERRAVQFPFSERADRLEEAVKNRLANRVSDRFFRAICGLKPYAENGGNRPLYLIELMDIPDKHRALIPVGDYTRLSSDIIRRQVPDFPPGIENCSFGSNRRDVVWRNPGPFAADQLGELVPPTTHMFEKKLNVPVEIVFAIGELNFRGPLVPILNKLVDVARETIGVMRDAAS